MGNENETNSSIQHSSTARWVFTTWLAVTIVVGLVANAMAIRVSLRSAVSHKIQVFYVVMTATDLVILLLVYFVNDVLAHGLYVWSAGSVRFLPSQSTTICHLQSYLFFSTQFCSNNTVLLLSIERCVAAHKPFWAKRIDVKASLATIAGVFVLGFGMHLWVFEIGEVYQLEQFDNICLPSLNSTQGFSALALFISADLGIPSVLSVVLNVATAVRVWRSFKRRQSMVNMPVPVPVPVALATRRSSVTQLSYVTSATRLWLADLRKDVVQSREVQITLTFVLTTFCQCALYLVAAATWLFYIAANFQDILHADSRQHQHQHLSYESDVSLPEVGLALCSIPHCLKAFIILKRTKLPRRASFTV